MNLINLKEEQGSRKTERREEKRGDDGLEPVEGSSVLALVYPCTHLFPGLKLRARLTGVRAGPTLPRCRAVIAKHSVTVNHQVG